MLLNSFCGWDSASDPTEKPVSLPFQPKWDMGSALTVLVENLGYIDHELSRFILYYNTSVIIAIKSTSILVADCMAVDPISSGRMVSVLRIWNLGRHQAFLIELSYVKFTGYLVC